MAETGISDMDFNQLLVDVSEWYEQRDFFNMLKVLYRDHIQIALLDKASNTQELLSLLCNSGNLSRTNLTILYDTIKATGQFALERKIKDKIPSCPNTREIEISKFSRYRQKLMTFGLGLNLKDVAKISCVLHMTKKYADSWDMIMDLEHRLIICTETIDEFTEKFRKSKVHHASDALHQMHLYTPIPMMISLIIVVIGILVGIIFTMPAHPEPSIDDDIREYFTDRQKDVYKNVKTMTPPTWNNEYEIDIIEVFTDLDLLISKREDERQKDNPAAKRRKSKPTTLAEVFSVVKSTKSCKVLITGEGGMGKTTILRYIAHNWATNSDDTFAGKILFLINIRDIKEGENFLDAIMQEITTPVENEGKTLSKDSIESFLKIHAYEIVLLLDGFDELRVDAKNPIQLFEDYDLKKYTVIITSRPENTIDFANRCDVHVKVEGFNPRNIKNYVLKHFNFLRMKDLGESLIQEFELDSYHLGLNHKEAFEMCRSPHLLVMICTMWREKQLIPKDLPELYKELICTIINQYIRRSNKEMTSPISQFDKIPKMYESAILTLGECMYRGLLTNTLSINRYDIEAVANNKTIFDLALDIGFVYKEKAEAEYDSREIYTTPHKMLSEALAGFYISVESQEEHFEDHVYEIIRSNKYLHMARLLAIGFMGSNAGELLKHWLIIRATNYYSLATHFEYIKTEHQQSVLDVLNENMSTEMKEHVADMAKSFRVYLYGKDTIHRDKHLVQLIRTFVNAVENNQFSMNVSTVIETSEQPLESTCKMIAHITLIVQVIPGSFNDKYLLHIVKKWGDEAIKIISTEWEKHHLIDEVHSLNFSYSRDIEVAQMCKILQIAPKLNHLYIDNCRLSGTTVNTMIEECQHSQVLFELSTLDINNNDLNDINGTLLSNLLKTNKFKRLDMSYCNLKGNIVGDMIKKYDRMDIVLKNTSLGLEGNDLSNIDGESLVKLVNILHGFIRFYGDYVFLTWSDYHLSANNLQDLVNACDENCRFKFRVVSLSYINLSSISGTTLATLFKIFPHLKYLQMANCNLIGNIVGDMLNEGDRMGVVLKDYSFYLKANDLSNIDGESLVKLVNVLHGYESSLKWSDYNLSANNLQDLVNSCDENCRFKFKWVDLNNINLSSICGTTLAKLFKFFPHLNHLSMINCKLTGNIVGEMLNECDTIGVVLKDHSIELEANDLSNIDGKSLVKLLKLYDDDSGYIKFSNYNLSADNLKDLVNACDESCRFIWYQVELNNINLSSISGTTLVNLFKLFPHLTLLNMVNCSLTDNIVGDMLNECDRMGVVLEDHSIRLEGNDLSNIDGELLVKLVNVLQVYDSRLKWSDYNLSADNLQDLVNACDGNCRFKFKWVDLNNINLSSVSGTTLAKLFEFFPHLNLLNMRYCNLIGNIVGNMIQECHRMGVVLKDHSVELEGNDLSNIDGESLVQLVNVLYGGDDDDAGYIKWSNYNLSADNLQDLVNACDGNCRFKFKLVNFNNINLSSISGITLTKLFKFFPHLILLNMINCNLIGNIVGNMIKECDRMGVVLKDHSIGLEGNDLSNIDGESLVQLVNVIHGGDDDDAGYIKWSNYNLSADNLQDLVNACDEHCRFKFKLVDLNNINLSSISGITLAKLFKFFPQLTLLDMINCKLTCNVVGDMLNECDRMDLVLKDHSIGLEGYDLSNIDGELLVKLLNVLYDDDSGYIKWNNYNLSADNLQDLVNACDENCRFTWKTVDLSDIDLSLISGTTLANLFKIFPHLNHLNMINCNLTGNIVGEMLNGVVLKNTSFRLKGNDLSNIDGESLFKLVNVLNDDYSLKWSNYNLSANNLQDLVNSCDENCRFKFIFVDLNNINLSSISGTALAKLFKLFPRLFLLGMSNCNLIGNIVGDMLNEFDRMGVVLKGNPIILDGNDLSNIDGESLVKLVKVFNNRDSRLKWSDYNLSVHNLQDLVNACDENCRFLKIFGFNLSNTNLSSISGTTLAKLFKIFPHLSYLNMANCSLTDNILHEMQKECDRMGVVLKEDTIDLIWPI